MNTAGGVLFGCDRTVRNSNISVSVFSSDFASVSSVDVSTVLSTEEEVSVLFPELLFVLPHPEKISVPANAIHNNAF